MEIHIQLAGIELGPYSEKQVRSYLDEGLLSLTDPARFGGTETWEHVGEVLARISAPTAYPVVPLETPTSEESSPVEVPEAAPIAPGQPSEVRRTSSFSTTTLPPNTKSRDTIRVPLPQLQKALAKQTTQGVKMLGAETAPAPTPVPAPAAPSAILKAKVAEPAKPSDMARTSLLPAVKILAKKSNQELRPVPAERASDDPKLPRPSPVPISFLKSMESTRTLPMSMGKVAAVSPAPEETPKPAEPAPKPEPALTLIAKPTSVVSASVSKSQDIKRTSLLSAVKALSPKPTPVLEQKAAPAIEEPTAPRAPETSAITFPAKAPQTARTAPMSAVRALPKKNDGETTNIPGSLAASSAPSPKEVPQAPESVVRFVPSTEKNIAKAPHVSPEAVFSSKSLKRTTGSLPSLVKALAKPPEEVPQPLPLAPAPDAEPESVTPASGVLDEPSAEKKSWLDTPAPIPSLFRSIADKLGLRKSKESAVGEVEPELPKAEETAPEVVDKAPVVRSKLPETAVLRPAGKSLRATKTLPRIEKPGELKTLKIVEGKAGADVVTADKTAKLGPRPLKSLSRTPEPITATLKPAEKTVEPVTRMLRPLSKPVESADKPAEPAAQPVEEVATDQLPTEAKPRRFSRKGMVLLAVVLVLGCLSLIVVNYVKSSYRSADATLQALKDGNQAQLTSGVDFPAVRQSLKDAVAAQITKSGASGASNPADGNSDPTAVLAMMKNSIDFYVTPEAISALAAKSDKLPKVEQGPVLMTAIASSILNGLNNLPVKSQGLVAYNHFAIDLDAAKLDFLFNGTDWKLNQVELKSNFQLPQAPGGTAPAQDLGASLSVPVIETYFDEGKAKFEKADWDGAIAAFSQVLALDSKQTVAYSNRGMAKQAKGDLDGAIADFTQALALDPKLAEAYFNRGEIKSTKNDLDGALADYTQSINLDPKLAPAFYKRGTIRTMKGDYEGAMADFTQDIALDPSQASAYSNRGYVRKAQNDLDGAISDFTQALAINPKIAGAYFNRGLAKEAKADLDGAISDFGHALDLDPKLTRAYYSRGIVKNTRNDLDGAIADYTQALALDPKLAPALTDRAVARQAKGDLNGALEDFNKALALDPKIADAYYSRGLIKEQFGDLDGAIADSSRAIDLDPKRAQAYYNRGFAKLVKGNLEGARNDLQKFCEMAPRDPYADHARLYLWLIQKAQNPNGTANQDLSDSLQNNWSLGPTDLVTKVAGFLLDRVPEADLFAAAASSNATKDLGQHCEVWYFAGMKKLLAGDKNAAVDYFRKCLATGQKDYCEYILAQAELQVLAPNP